ncbi:hypothetical protein M422DRAFT_276124 [Sphaerobolus stellatus SS14]|uniref:Transmembrane protein n=1 Tax=Sphaerobolus stellatus (strain SS14) TaxID=990650 RepID=A0A0C9UCZ0_SPHS4|nr:hypothetical protein M422DRAFT_276124 [Sphaerobolus stellatus SS14]
MPIINQTIDPPSERPETWRSVTSTSVPTRTYLIYPAILDDIQTASTTANASASTSQSSTSIQSDPHFGTKFAIGAAIFVVFYFCIFCLLQGDARYRRHLSQDGEVNRQPDGVDDDLEVRPERKRIVFNPPAISNT